MINLPTVKQLRYLIALEKHLHFGKAAEACFVTQSAFSVAIKELETILNTSLVDRTNRSVVFTSTGKLVAQQARLAIFDLEGIVDIAKSYQEPLSGTLKMGIIPTIAPFLLPRILPLIRKKFPKLELYLKEEQTHHILIKTDHPPQVLRWNARTLALIDEALLVLKKQLSIGDMLKIQRVQGEIPREVGECSL